MTVERLKQICDGLVLDENIKKKIYENVCENTDTISEVSESSVDEGDTCKSKIPAAGNTEDARTGRKRGRLLHKKRLVLLFAACLMLGGITIFAADQIVQRTHMRNHPHITEGKGIILGDEEIATFYEEMTAKEQEEYDREVEALKNGTYEYDDSTIRTELSYDSIEEAAIDLNLSPVLPEITDLGWRSSSVTVEKQEDSIQSDDGRYVWHITQYDIDYQYVHKNSPDRVITCNISVDAFENSQDQYHGGYARVFDMSQNDMQNMREYENANGNQFALYDYDTEESMGTTVLFSYSDRYWIDKIARIYIIDEYVCSMNFENITEEEIQEILEKITY